MQALQATHFLNNVASKSQATLWIDSAIHTETQHKVSNVKENGSELGGELGLAVKGEVEWSVGVPELVGASGKFSPEVNAKFIGKAIRKTIAGQENSRINSVSQRRGRFCTHSYDCETDNIGSRSPSGSAPATSSPPGAWSGAGRPSSRAGPTSASPPL